jgi:hypothetical protein
MSFYSENFAVRKTVRIFVADTESVPTPPILEAA